MKFRFFSLYHLSGLGRNEENEPTEICSSSDPECLVYLT